MKDDVTITPQDIGIDKIVLHMQDGSQRVIDKGMVACIDEGKGSLVMECAHMSGAELIDMLKVLVIGTADMLGYGDELDDES
ncbi:hypothetical protein D3C85_846120 [compost metagenome]